jgi:hypothetical protein
LALTQLTIGHRTLQIETDALEFPMGEVTGESKCIGPSQYSHIKDVHAKVTGLASRTGARNEEQRRGRTHRVGKNKG